MSRLIHSRGAPLVLAFMHHAICKKWCIMTSVLRTIDCDCNEVTQIRASKDPGQLLIGDLRPSEKQARCALPVTASHNQADHNTPMRRLFAPGIATVTLMSTPAEACSWLQEPSSGWHHAGPGWHSTRAAAIHHTCLQCTRLSASTEHHEPTQPAPAKPWHLRYSGWYMMAPQADSTKPILCPHSTSRLTQQQSCPLSSCCAAYAASPSSSATRALACLTSLLACFLPDCTSWQAALC